MAFANFNISFDSIISNSGVPTSGGERCPGVDGPGSIGGVLCPGKEVSIAARIASNSASVGGGIKDLPRRVGSSSGRRANKSAAAAISLLVGLNFTFVSLARFVLSIGVALPLGALLK